MERISPITDADRRRSRSTGILEDGEYVHSSAIFMRDAADTPSIDTHWREWAAREMQGNINPADWASRFVKFATDFAAQLGADGLAAIAGLSVAPKDVTEVTDAMLLDQRAVRKARMSDAWRKPPAAYQPPPKPLATGDAKADYAAAAAHHKATISNAWRG